MSVRRPLATLPPSALPFVGRGPELDALRALVAAAIQEGTGGVAVVEGAAGAGKTRLVAEALRVADAPPASIVVCGTDELERDRPLGPLATGLGLVAGADDPERRDMARLLLGEGGPAHQPRPGRVDLGYRVVEAVTAHLDRLASDGPLVLVVEDLHWADALTIRAIRSFGRSLAHLPVALILTLRPWPRNPDLARMVDGLVATGARHLALPPLDPVDAARLAEAVTGESGTATAAQVARAGGNPLFVIELVRAMEHDPQAATSAAGPAGGDPPGTPATLRAALRYQLSSLPEPCLDVLKVAAVMGERFAVTDLAAVMGQGPAELLGALDAAIRAGWLLGTGDELAFRHELVREVVYRDVPLSIRRGLHRAAAQVLKGAGASPSRVADHLVLGATAGDAEAVDWLVEHARQIAARAPRSALRLLERATDLVDPDGAALDEFVCDLVPLLIQTGRAGDARQLSRRVLDQGPPPQVEAGLRWALGEVLWTTGELEAALAELEPAARLPGALPEQRTGAAALAAHLRLFLGEVEAAAQAAASVLVEARAGHDDVASCLALETLAIAADARGRVAEAVGHAEEAVAIATRSSRLRIGHLNPHLYLGWILIDADRLDDAETVLQDGRRRAEARGAVVWLPLYHCGLAMRRLLVGQWDDALAEVEVGLAVAEDVGTRLHVSFLHGLGAWTAIQRGDLGRALTWLKDASDEFTATTTPSWQARAAEGWPSAEPRWPMEWGLWVGGLLHESHGHPAEALGLLEQAWALAAPMRCFLSHRFIGPDLVRLATAAGELATAEAVTATLADARGSTPASGDGAALRCRGLLTGDPDLLLQAVERYRQGASRVELAFTLEEAGTLLAGAQRREEAVEALEEAVSLFEQMSAGRAVARADAVLRSLGVRHRRVAGSAEARFGWDSLTPTEMTVAGLAAEGLTNRQIGERLFVSRRTVETHLAHVYAKLGIPSRAGLAAEFARRQR